jgi:hypothetical protein
MIASTKLSLLPKVIQRRTHRDADPIRNLAYRSLSPPDFGDHLDCALDDLSPAGGWVNIATARQ